MITLPTLMAITNNNNNQGGILKVSSALRITQRIIRVASKISPTNRYMAAQKILLIFIGGIIKRFLRAVNQKRTIPPLPSP